MELTEKQKNELVAFLDACDDFCAGKFILADSKSARILETIERSNLLHALISECLTNFSFEREFEKAKQNSKVKGFYFKLPDEPLKIIALSVSLIKEIMNQKLNFPSFLKEMFPASEDKSSFEIFCGEVIIPFKTQVANILDMEIWDGTPRPKHEEPEIVPPDTDGSEEFDFFSRMIIILQQMHDAVKVDKRIKPQQKSELLCFLNGMVEACKIENNTILSGYIVAFHILFKKIKCIKFFKEEMQQNIEFHYEKLVD